MGFDWIWFLSVWQTGPAGQRISRANPEWRREFQETLPDLREEDIAGSGFAITGYTRSSTSLAATRRLLVFASGSAARGLRLMLDFVPNHTGLDHPWVEEHPEYYVQGTEQDLAHAPQNYTRVKRTRGDLVLAHGRDPYFPGWPDTLQLDYGNPATQEAMIGELREDRRAMRRRAMRHGHAGAARRVRTHLGPPRAALLAGRDPSACASAFRASASWPRSIGTSNGRMQQQGFDYAYDKRLYDRLRDGHARPVREHLHAGLDYQSKLARFMENHDEPRAAATFAPGMHEAAAVITYLSPGLRFFHQGQFEGRRKRISPHLVRAPLEANRSARCSSSTTACSPCSAHPTVRDGDWRLLECAPAWEGNWTSDCFVAWLWTSAAGDRRLVAVNYAANQSQCYVRLPPQDRGDRPVRFEDLMGAASFRS